MPRFFLSIFASIIGAALAGCDQKQKEEAAFKAALEKAVAAAEARQAERVLKAVKAQKVFSGMSEPEVLRSLGEPDRSQRVTLPELREHLETEWRYYDGRDYVFFDYNGKVALISDILEFKPYQKVA